jgi:hypothetical protein
MGTDSQKQPSFSPRQRWRIGFDVVVRTVLVLAVVVMVNYLGAQFFDRFRFFGRVYLSSQTRIELSPRTVHLLDKLTNHIKVTLYYDRDDGLYPAVVALLNEYRSVSPLISVKAVDYVRDAGEAEKVKEQYKLNSPTDKNLVIFDCAGRVRIVNGNALAQYVREQVPSEIKGQLEFVKRPTAFMGEKMFTSALLAVTNPKPFKACFLQGHGEPDLNGRDETGYLEFASILAQNYIAVQPWRLLGDNPVPADCDLLIIAGPRTVLSNPELQKIDQYLSQGGRLFALLDYSSLQQPTGLEDVLAHWGVNVGVDVVQDPKNTTTSGQDVVVWSFGRHPVVNPLTQLALQLILPRPVSQIKLQNPPADVPPVQVDEIAFSGPESVLFGNRTAAPRSYPLVVAVEQNAVKGVATPRGTTRMVVVGDSIFLDNRQIKGGANHDFVGYAANWLLDRSALLEGIGPRPVTEFRLMMTHAQRRNVRWILLGALPGAVLLLGGLVWLKRRK